MQADNIRNEAEGDPSYRDVVFISVSREMRSIVKKTLDAVQWGLVGVLVFPLVMAFPINGGDATWVSQSARALVQCARDDVWKSCPGTFQFGWLQHAPAMFLVWKGFGDEAVVAVLTGLNFVQLSGWLNA